MKAGSVFWRAIDFTTSCVENGTAAFDLVAAVRVD
jgi:hypothetical protein